MSTMDEIKFACHEHIGTQVYWYRPDLENPLPVRAGEELRDGAEILVSDLRGTYIVMKLGITPEGTMVGFTPGRKLVAVLAFQPDLECTCMVNMDAIRKLELRKEPQPLCHTLYHPHLGDGMHKDTCPECGFKKEDKDDGS